MATANHAPMIPTFHSKIVGPKLEAVRHQSHLALLLNFSLATLGGVGVHAQQDPNLKRGSEIEIVSESLPNGIAVGWLVTLTRDTLTYFDSTGTNAVPISDIGQLRVNVGRDAGSLNAATVLGAMLGALIGTMTKPADYECLSSLETEADCGEEVPSELVGALIGAGAFRLLARFTVQERWAHVSLDRLLYDEEGVP